MGEACSGQANHMYACTSPVPRPDRFHTWPRGLTRREPNPARRPSDTIHRRGVVLRHALAFGVDNSEVVLAISKALIGSLRNQLTAS
jgi:hypothetical protein